jgi:hypothetical protein
MNSKNIKFLGWLASAMTTVMFFSYIDQIKLNLTGYPGSVILPISTVFNCAFWCSYAIFQEKVIWPIFVCNLFGIIFGTLTTFTAFFI